MTIPPEQEPTDIARPSDEGTSPSDEAVAPATAAAPKRGSSRWQRIRTHPILSRLPLLIVVALGYWLYMDPSAPSTRELVFQLGGPEREEVRTLEIQVIDEKGIVLERAQRFFDSAPPTEVRLEARLPRETFELRLFARDRDGHPLAIQRRELEITERKTYVLRASVRRQDVEAQTPSR